MVKDGRLENRGNCLTEEITAGGEAAGQAEAN
jgi:hypothetical protein